MLPPEEPPKPVPWYSLSTWKARYFEHIERIRTDARFSMRLLGMSCCLFIVVEWLIMAFYSDNEHFEEDDSFGPLCDTSSYHNTLYSYALLITLMVALTALIDTLLVYFVLGFDALDLLSPREISRIFMIIFLAIPNLFIFFEILPSELIELVMFCQYICMFYNIVFRILSLATTQKVVPLVELRPIFFFAICTISFAFICEMSLHLQFPAPEVWKALYSACLVVLHIVSLRKVKEWITLSSRLSKISNTRDLFHNNAVSFFSLSIALFISCSLVVTHLVGYSEQWVFFPKRHRDAIALEWIFCAVLLLWTATRNFELRKAEVKTMEQLLYNRKMTRSISHEIRTPLNTAFMALDLLISSLSSPPEDSSSAVAGQKETPQNHSRCHAMLEIAESIKEGCDIALAILNQLLTFEKLSAGMMQLENKLISLRQLLDSNMRLFRMQAQQAGITFKLESGEIDMDIYLVYVDENKMNQVLRNLISNAMKFTPRGGVVEVKLQWIRDVEREAIIGRFTHQPTLARVMSNVTSLSSDSSPHAMVSERSWIRKISKMFSMHKSDTMRVVNLNSTVPMHTAVAGAKDAGTILISVVDSGPGVSKEDQKRLFQEYVQINPGELQKGGGSGLGLSISKSIVHLHGGNIGMSSAGKGKGSTFYVELPAYRQADHRAVEGSMDASTTSSLQARVLRTVSRRVLGSGSSNNSNNNNNFNVNNANNNAGNASVSNVSSQRSLLQRLSLRSWQSPSRERERETATPLVANVSLSPRSMLHKLATGFTHADDVAVAERDIEEASSHPQTMRRTIDVAATPLPSPHTPNGPPPHTPTLLQQLFATPGTKITPTLSSKKHLNAADCASLNAATANVSQTIHIPARTSFSATAATATAVVAALAETETERDRASGALSEREDEKERDRERDREGERENKLHGWVQELKSNCCTASERDDGKEKERERESGKVVRFQDESSCSLSLKEQLLQQERQDRQERELQQLSQKTAQPTPLPVTTATTATATVSKTRRGSTTSSRQSFFFAPPRALNILVVDDSAPNRKMLARLLERDKHTVTQAENGAVAVELVTNNMLMRAMFTSNCKAGAATRVRTGANKDEDDTSAESDGNNSSSSQCRKPPPAFDLILMDFYMPVMTGPVAIAALRKLGYTGMIVGVSGVMDDDVNDFVAAGANLVLLKPITLNALWKALKATDFGAQGGLVDVS